MQLPYSTTWPQFYTATILNWNPILTTDGYKNLIIECLQFLVKNKRIELNAFIIMNNHIHIIWGPINNCSIYEIQISFMKYTSNKIIARMQRLHGDKLILFRVNKYDRKYQIWKRESLSIELFTPSVFCQKLEYIHDNPVRAGICKYPEDYYYSSAKYYHDGTDTFDMLTHYAG